MTIDLSVIIVFLFFVLQVLLGSAAPQCRGLFFLLHPMSHEVHYIRGTSGFTRLSMKTKYVCRGLISLYVNFHNNRTLWSTNLHVNICRWGKEK